MKKALNYLLSFIKNKFFIKNTNTTFITKHSQTENTDKNSQPFDLSLHNKVTNHINELINFQKYEEIFEVLKIYKNVPPSLIQPFNKEVLSILLNDTNNKELGIDIWFSENSLSNESLNLQLIKKLNILLDIINYNSIFRDSFFEEFRKHPSLTLANSISYSPYAVYSFYFLDIDEKNNIVNKVYKNTPEFMKKFQSLLFTHLDDYFSEKNKKFPLVHSAILYSYLREKPQYLNSKKFPEIFTSHYWFFLGLANKINFRTSKIATYETYIPSIEPLEKVIHSRVLNELNNKTFKDFEFNNDNLQVEHLNLMNEIKMSKFKEKPLTSNLEDLKLKTSFLNLSLNKELKLNNLISNVADFKQQNLNMEEINILNSIEKSIFDYFNNYIQVVDILSKEELEKSSNEYISSLESSFDDLVTRISNNNIQSLKNNLHKNKITR